MKPIIIWMDDRDSTKLTKKELENLLEQAYNQGYELGYNAGRAAVITTTPSPSSTPMNPYPTWTLTNPSYIPCEYNKTMSIGGSGITTELKG